MLTECLVQESAGAMRAREGGKWQATLITAGEGSSGRYAEEMLAERGATAFPAGTKLWFKHPRDDEGAGERDPRDQWGYLEEDAEYVEGEGLVGKIKVLPHWKEVVDSLGEQASLSIYAVGERDDAGNVTLAHSVTNSIDIVSYPGREGSGLKKKLESARSGGARTPDAASAQENPTHQEESMDELKEMVEKLAESLSTLAGKFDTFVAESKAEAEGDEDRKAEEKDKGAAVAAAVEAVEAVKSAELLKSLEEPLIEAAKRGEDVTAGIESAKKVMAEAKASIKESASTYFIGGAGSSTDDFNLGVMN